MGMVQGYLQGDCSITDWLPAGTYPLHRRQAERPLRWTRQPLPSASHAVMEWTLQPTSAPVTPDARVAGVGNTSPPQIQAVVWINPAFVPP